MNNGMTVVDACDEVGLPRSTYYDIINKHPEAIAEYQEMIEANARMQLGLILYSKSEILQKLIAEGLSDETAPRDRLAIFKALNEMSDKLAETIHVENEIELQAREFMRDGPKLKQGKSRLSPNESSINLEVLT